MSGGKIKIVTVAPNMEGAEAFIREFKDDVVISVGHTGADYDCAARAMQEGAHHVTHLYNAMNPLGHRAPGVISAAADDPGVYGRADRGWNTYPSVSGAKYISHVRGRTSCTDQRFYDGSRNGEWRV